MLWPMRFATPRGGDVLLQRGKRPHVYYGQAVQCALVRHHTFARRSFTAFDAQAQPGNVTQCVNLLRSTAQLKHFRQLSARALSVAG